MSRTPRGFLSHVRRAAVRSCAVFLEDSCAGCGGALSRCGGLAGPLCLSCAQELETDVPLRCVACSLPLSAVADAPRGDDELCVPCSVQPACPLLVAPREYKGLAQDLICGLKYGGRRELADELAQATLRDPQVRALLSEVEVLVPAPTTMLRKRRRGFCQAELLASALATQFRRLGGRAVRVAPVLRRRPGQAPQVSLGRGQRTRALRGSMFVWPWGRRQVLGRRVLVVDDVITTGATSAAAVRTLEALGAEPLGVVACARTAAPQGGS